MQLNDLFYFIGLMTSSYFGVYIIMNIINYIKLKEFLKTEKDYEISFLKEKNKLLQNKIDEQQTELKNISELIYKG
jgi:hypothetical protein